MPTNRQTLKQYFETGKKPKASQYAEWIDSFIHLKEDGLYVDENYHLLIGKVEDETLAIRARLHIKPVLDETNAGILIEGEHASLVVPDGQSIQVGHLETDNNFIERLHIDADGNVGIDTNNPREKLEINGTMLFTDANEAKTLIYYNTSNNGIPNNDGFRIRYDPNFFAQEADALVFEKTDFNQESPDGGIAFVNTGQNGEPEGAFVIRGNGNIGIGTNDPQEKLEIEGNLSLKKSHSFSNPGNDTPEIIFERAGGSPISRSLLKISRLKGEQAFDSGNNGVLGRLNFFCNYLNPLSNQGGGGGGTTELLEEQQIMTLESTSGDNGKVIIWGDLEVRGTARKSGSNTWSQLPGGGISDMRVKEEVERFNEGLAIIKNLHPISFKFNGKGNTPSNGEVHIGFNAQEVKEVFPSMVNTFKTKLNIEDETETELLSLDSTPVMYMMLNAIKELDKRLSNLEEKKVSKH